MVCGMPQNRVDTERYVELAEEYLINDREGRQGERCVDRFGWDTRVILSAPHAVRHLSRSGEAKAADGATGGLVRFISECTGAMSVVASGGWTRANANYVLDGWCPYRQTLVEVGGADSVIVDLHGMADTHDADVCIGTGAEPDRSSEAVDFTVEYLRDLGLTVAVDRPFNASNPGTITSWAQGQNFRAFQLEVCSALRRPWQDPETALRFVYDLCGLAKGLATV
jgi:hypothetical protein